MNKSRSAALATLALFFFLGFAGPAHAAWRAECLSMRSAILRRAVGYCALLPPGFDASKPRRYPVLYFLHGLGDNQQMFIRPGGLSLMEDLSERGEIGNFLIVTPQAGSSFYINSRGGRVRYEDFLLREFFPYIERHYPVERGRRARGIAGISMGGYGALHLAFSHSELFTSVSASSAALMERIPAVTVGGGQGLAGIRIFGGAFGSPPDPLFYKRESPLSLARTFHPDGLKIYFDCGTEDDYGFDAGARQLDKILTARHIPHEFHLYPGGHNWMYFADHLPASLEFHSRAFGVTPEKK